MYFINIKKFYRRFTCSLNYIALCCVLELTEISVKVAHWTSWQKITCTFLSFYLLRMSLNMFILIQRSWYNKKEL